MSMDTLQRLLTEALREHLVSRKPIRLPEGAGPLWRAFIELDAARTWHAHGPNPITWQDMAAYVALMNLPLEPRHIAVIRALDGVVVDHYQKAVTDARRTANQTPAVSQRPLTPALFDALMG
jgi:hypothetical protein